MQDKVDGTPDPVRARNYAAVCHGAQLYSDEVPYPVHLEQVVNVLQRFGFLEPEIVCAGWVHDAIEDTNTSYNDIKKRFGLAVAEFAYAVTSELGRNRTERNAKTYGKIAGRFAPTAIKLADRIANVEYSSANGGKQDMYVKEYPGFYQALYHDGDKMGRWQTPTTVDIIPKEDDKRIERMWNHLTLLLGSPHR